MDWVIYCADGQNTAAFAASYFRKCSTDSLWFIGVDSSGTNRNAEYVIGRDEEKFTLHESFFTRDVLAWTHGVLGGAYRWKHAAVFGYSCGGAFAASMGIRHPELFPLIFAFSVAGRPVTQFDEEPSSNLRNSKFFFRSGTREPDGMKKYMTRLGKWLGRSGAVVDQGVENGGHEFSLWSTALIGAIQAAIVNDAC